MKRVLRKIGGLFVVASVVSGCAGNLVSRRQAMQILQLIEGEQSNAKGSSEYEIPREITFYSSVTTIEDDEPRQIETTYVVSYKKSFVLFEYKDILGNGIKINAHYRNWYFLDKNNVFYAHYYVPADLEWITQKDSKTGRATFLQTYGTAQTDILKSINDVDSPSYFYDFLNGLQNENQNLLREIYRSKSDHHLNASVIRYNSTLKETKTYEFSFEYLDNLLHTYSYTNNLTEGNKTYRIEYEISNNINVPDGYSYASEIGESESESESVSE